MDALSSLYTSQGLVASRPTAVSLSVIGFSLPRFKTRACIRKQSLRVARASIAVEQHTQDPKVALIRIGTRGRYRHDLLLFVSVALIFTHLCAYQRFNFKWVFTINCLISRINFSFSLACPLAILFLLKCGSFCLK